MNTIHLNVVAPRAVTGFKRRAVAEELGKPWSAPF
jgi:hypothetical protein